MGLAQSIAALFSRSGKGNSPSTSEEHPAHLLGRRGERWAANYLRRHRHRILYRNFRSPGGGEVDLVCRDKPAGELVFVEVKTRTSADFGSPGEAVNAAKRRLIARGALAWLRLLNDPTIIYRFDIIEIILAPGSKTPEINHVKDAFPLPEPWR